MEAYSLSPSLALSPVYQGQYHSCDIDGTGGWSDSCGAHRTLEGLFEVGPGMVVVFFL